jgi:hypothetical protein
MTSFIARCMNAMNVIVLLSGGRILLVFVGVEC